jgi:flagellar motor switch protein FliN/FliY
MAETSNPIGVPPTGKSRDEFAQFLDVPMKIRVEVGRRNMKVRDILTLHRESVFNLAKSAGENIEVFVNGKLMAYGEVVEMEGNTGIRITDLHEPN